MRVLVVGATGYVGGAVARRLRERGHEVIAFVRSSSKRGAVERIGARVVEQGSDPLDQALERAAGSCEAVVYASGIYDGTEGLVVAALVRGLGLAGHGGSFLFTSGTGVFGNTGPAGVTERDVPEPEKHLPLPLSALFRQRLQVEEQVRRAHGVRGIVIRPALVYGHGGSAPLLGILNAARQAGRLDLAEGGRVAWSTVHLDDLADLFALALVAAPAGTVLHAASAEPVPLASMARAVHMAMGARESPRSITVTETMQSWGPLGAFANVDMRIHAQETMALLDWEPRGPSLVSDIIHGSYRQILEQPSP